MLELTETVGEIGKKINQALADEINTVIKSKKDRILRRCKDLAASFILSQPEISSLSEGTPQSLEGQFGLIPGQGDIATSEIVDAVTSSITIKFVPFDHKFRGGVDVFFQPDNFANLLDLPSGYTASSKGLLHWMEWLLKRGDEIIIVNYSYNPQSGLGRSGLGNMMENGVFRVPPSFSGTTTNNFITRALVGKKQEEAISAIFQSELG
tara:strand:- start:2981 stop:3607 length:627 start_codon:yes stop_codon:yes gene_type:complete